MWSRPARHSDLRRTTDVAKAPVRLSALNVGQDLHERSRQGLWRDTESDVQAFFGWRRARCAHPGPASLRNAFAVRGDG